MNTLMEHVLVGSGFLFAATYLFALYCLFAGGERSRLAPVKIGASKPPDNQWSGQMPASKPLQGKKRALNRNVATRRQVL